MKHDLPPNSAAIGRQNILWTTQEEVEEQMSKSAGPTVGPMERSAEAGQAKVHAQMSQINQNLSVRYGKIGIPAVAAALRYCDAGRNPAYAPVAPRNDHRLIEIAA